MRGKEYVIKTLKEISMLLGDKDLENVHKRLESLLLEIGLETDLSVLGIKTKDDIETIIAHSFNPQQVKNNPSVLSRDALMHILSKSITMSIGMKRES